MAVVITGGLGFLGRQLARQLAERGEEVVVLDLADAPAELPSPGPPIRLVPGSVTERERVRAALAAAPRCRVVYHLASMLSAESERDPELAVRVNVEGTRNVLQAAVDAGVPRLVYTSSVAAYPLGLPQPVDEDAPTTPITWYGQTKAMAEQWGRFYARRFGLDFRVARPAAVIGPGRASAGAASMFPSLIIERAAQRQPYAIDVSPDTAIPYVYDRDVVAGLRLLGDVEAPEHRTFNFCAGRVTAGELLDLVTRVVGRVEMAFRPVPAVEAVARQWQDLDLSSERARRELGWAPAADLEGTVRDFVARVRGAAS